MLIKRKSQPSPPPGFTGEEDESGFESKLTVLEKLNVAKRPAEDAAAAAAKKPKRIHNVHHRLWSAEDEIAILKGMVDYAAEKKSDPNLERDAFHDFIREDLHVDATRLQLRNKIRKMRLKYESNSFNKRTKFSKPHDERVYDLSKLIWGKHGDGGGKAVVSAAARKSAPKKVNTADPAADGEQAKDAAGETASEKVNAAAAEVEAGSDEGEKSAAAEGVLMSVEERMLIAGREVYEIGGEKVEGEEEWRRLRVEELEVYQKEMEVRAAKSKVRIAQTKLVLDAINRGKLSLF